MAENDKDFAVSREKAKVIAEIAQEASVINQSLYRIKVSGNDISILMASLRRERDATTDERYREMCNAIRERISTLDFPIWNHASTAPKDGRYILVFFMNELRHFVARWSRGYWRSTCDDDLEPTFVWCELPIPYPRVEVDHG